MKKTHSTKRALLSAILALVMTVSMLVGTTFAWFTDSVTSAGNKIVAGNLDVKLHMYDATQDKYVDISNSDKPIFGDGALASADTGATLWEPGKTQVVYLAIENAGSLSLQYKVALNVTDIEKDINLALSYKITPDAKAGDVTSWDGTNALGVVAGEQIVSNGAVPMKSGDMHYFALSVHMDELAGNEYMDGSITFDLAVLASQLGNNDFAEDDSFGDDYDAGALFPGYSEVSPLGNEDITLTTEGDDTATVTLPAELVSNLAGDGVTEVYLKTIGIETELDANGDAKVTIKSLEIYDQDQDVIELEGNTAVIPVKLYVGTEFAGKYAVVAHDGANVATTVVDAEGYVSYNTTHFCEVTIDLTADEPEIPGMGSVTAPDVEEGQPEPEFDPYELVSVVVGNNFYTVSNGMSKSWKTMANAEQISADIYLPEDLIAYSMMHKNGDLTMDSGVHSYLTLKADLDFKNYSWAPIGRFYTEIDGNDKKISNLNDSFFGCVYDVRMKNVTIENVNAKGSASGVLAKELAGDVFFENVTVAGDNFVTYVKDNATNWPEGGVGVGAICGVSLIGCSSAASVNVKVTGTIEVNYNGAFFTNYTNLENLSASKEFGLNVYKANAGASVTLDGGAITTNGTYYIFDAADLEDDFALDIASGKYYVLSAKGLAAFADAVNGGTSFSRKTVALFRDVDLQNIEWTPIGNSTNSFQGIFDGQNYTVSNLNVAMAGRSNAGLFGMTTNGEVKNLTVENAKVVGRLNVGVVAGTPYTTKYTNITVKGHVEVDGMAYVGGVGGKNAYANWDNVTVDVDSASYVKADSVENGVAYRTYVGGVIGFMGEGTHTVSNVISNIDVYGSTCDVGGIVGIAHYGNNFKNITCYGDVSVFNAADASDAEELGGIAGVWMNSGHNVSFDNCNFLGKLSANIEGVDLSDNIITGKGYYETTSNKLLINGKAFEYIVVEVEHPQNELLDLKEYLDSSEADYYITLQEDFSGSSGSGGYNAAGIKISGDTLDGNGNALTVTDANSTWDCAIYHTGGTVKNLTIGGGFRGIFTAGCSSDIIIDNCVIDNVCYTISSDGSNPNYSIIVTNTTLNGWTSFTGGYKSVSFTNCNFGQGTGGYKYAYCRPYSDTTFTGCVFEEGYGFDSTRAVNTFVDCYVGDTLITADNVVELLGSGAANIRFANTK
ncbi:MAG: hypothetical protein IJE25_05870 [Clostridia bacterium]|nr:hypothetical protein [Clostridia bacterium]